MNSFIRAMEVSGELSAAELKKLFRRASKKAHPDLSGSSGETFLRLKAEYEEALAFLVRDAASGTDSTRGTGSRPAARTSPTEARRRLLSGLRAFTVKLFTTRADPILDGMIVDAADYDPGIAALLARYRDEIYRIHSEWSSKANLYYTHSIFISGARQLFLYFDEGKPLHRTLVLRYREAMDGWTRNLAPEYTGILSRLYDWIESELDKEPLASDL
jgi:hypothetical protein